MVCRSITSLPNACGAGVIAGLEKIYMISYKDLQPISSGSLNVYSVATNEVVNNIGLVSGKNYIEIGTLQSTAGYKETFAKNNEKGIPCFIQQFDLLLSDLTLENKIFIESIINQSVSILLKTRTGKYFAAGLDGNFRLISLNGGTGTAEGDLIGYNLSFQGVSRKRIPLVDESIIPGLFVAGSGGDENHYVFSEYMDSYFE